ncbi:MAG: nucleotidyl transferase AbiEii/AbiGii toxin family protein, partial [Candidatus Thermoplasmatota archaeon]
MLWGDIISTSKKMDTSAEHVFREYMQKTVLTVLSRNGYFNKLVFQGGTALRLFYGNPRFSEDIDLVVKQSEKKIDDTALSSKIETFAKDWFPFLNQVSVTQQKNTSEMQRFIVKTKGEQKSQITRIHIEIAYVPSYINQPKILDFPPLNPAVRVEELVEILADKLTAVGCRSYVKGRDLWDIYFLTEEKNVDTSTDLISKKIAD